MLPSDAPHLLPALDPCAAPACQIVAARHLIFLMHACRASLAHVVGMARPNARGVNSHTLAGVGVSDRPLRRRTNRNPRREPGPDTQRGFAGEYPLVTLRKVVGAIVAVVAAATLRVSAARSISRGRARDATHRAEPQDRRLRPFRATTGWRRRAARGMHIGEQRLGSKKSTKKQCFKYVFMGSTIQYRLPSTQRILVQLASEAPHAANLNADGNDVCECTPRRGGCGTAKPLPSRCHAHKQGVTRRQSEG